MEDEDEDSKTEEPTQRKLEQAAEKGDIAKSMEVPTLFTLGTVALIISMAFGPMMKGMVSPLRGLIEHADSLSVTSGFGNVLLELGVTIGPGVLLPLSLMMIGGVLSHLIQSPFQITPEKLMPDFTKVSPLAGFKRQFSMESVANLVKGLIKLVVVFTVMFNVLWPKRNQLEAVLAVEPLAQLAMIRDLAQSMMMAVLSAFIVIAGLDYLWVRQRWLQKHRMTLYQVKQEHKEQEGDPHLKGKIRQLRMSRAKNRMVTAVPTATVIITNPTHYAVALRYVKGMNAPVCVAKGVDEVALVIRKLGEKAKVPIVENPPLARTLYATVDVNQPIKEEQFKAVADIIGYVLGLRGKKRWSAR